MIGDIFDYSNTICTLFDYSNSVQKYLVSTMKSQRGRTVTIRSLLVKQCHQCLTYIYSSYAYLQLKDNIKCFS